MLKKYVIMSAQVLSLTANVERMSSGGLNATTFRLTTKIENRIELKY
jgi:hypothetical protein